VEPNVVLTHPPQPCYGAKMVDIIIRYNAHEDRARVTPVSDKGKEWFRNNVVCGTSTYLMVDKDEANEFAIKLLGEGLDVITR
jgi:hypothetical protein